MSLLTLQKTLQLPAAETSLKAVSRNLIGTLGIAEFRPGLKRARFLKEII